MCLNPHLLLGYKVYYKGYEKTLLFWNTAPEEYFRGYVNISDAIKEKRAGGRLVKDLVKYGLLSCNYYNNGDFMIKAPIIFNIRFEIPCRTCLACTRSRAKEWSIRCHLESLRHKDNYFITLTYNEKSVPRNYFRVYDAENDDFKTRSVMTLNKPHTIQFMKSLRQLFSRDFSHTGIRFFMCGEYGTSTARPHYHYILFNLPLNDLVLIGHSKTGNPLYRSKTIERVWKYGFVTVQKYSIETARYTAQYCCKKLNKSQAKLQSREMEFINMSRSPGIGSQYFFENCDKIYNVKDGSVIDNFNFVVNKNGDIKKETFSMPKAFLRYFKYFTDLKREIDTEDGQLRGLLNEQGDFIFDVLNLKKFNSSLYMEEQTKTNMNAYGFDYEKDRYSPRYLLYLDRIMRDSKEKFKIIRNSC